MAFSNKIDYVRFCELMDYYRFVSPGLRFSFYNRLNVEEKEKYMKRLLDEGETQVLIYAFCLLPNHFHLLLKELCEEGISKFLSNLQNSYARYLNFKEERKGSLFQEMFKAVRVETDEQFIHVARYIHLNPYSNFFIKRIEDLETYPWSSLIGYVSKEQKFGFVDGDFLSSFYSTSENLKKFTFDQADYQKKLEEIRFLSIE